MKTNQILFRGAVVATVSFLFATVLTRSEGQAVDSRLQSEIQDLAAKRNTLDNELADFGEMMKSLQGAEQDAALAVEIQAQRGETELEHASLFLLLYSKMQCDPDRATARNMAKNRLGLYSTLLDSQANHISQNLAFMKLPATVQTSIHLRDEMRTAKQTVDSIIASLD